MTAETGNTDLTSAVMHAMHEGGQQTADEIANETRNGCFVHCDGWPEAVDDLMRNIILELTDAEAEKRDELIAKAKRFSRLYGRVQAVCRAECPGAYSLFGPDDELYEDDETPIVVKCPVKDRLAQVVAELTSRSE